MAETDELQLEELVRLRTEIREKLDRLSATYRAMDGKLDRLSEKLDGLSEKLARVRSLVAEQLTLAEIEPYQSFDADWVSFADDSPVTPSVADMTA